MEKLYVIIAQSRTGHNFVYHNFLSWNPDAPVARVEGYAPEAISYKLILSLNQQLTNLGNERELIYFIVVRDFKNWLASYMMMWWGRKKKHVYDIKDWYKKVNLESKVRIWNALHHEAIGNTDYLGQVVCIDYSHFKEDVNWRKWLCNLIGGTYSEDKLGYVPQGGGGSSFNARTMQGKGQQMKTDTRYQQIVGEEIEDYYNELLTKYNY